MPAGSRPRMRAGICASAPAAITPYSGTSRLAVAPALSIGIRNGSAPTARSGSASGRRAMNTASATKMAIATAASAAVTAGRSRNVSNWSVS